MRKTIQNAETKEPFACFQSQGGAWKRAAIENMAAAFSKRGGDLDRGNEAEIDRLHSKIGQLVVERDFLANASVHLLGTRGKKW